MSKEVYVKRGTIRYAGKCYDNVNSQRGEKAQAIKPAAADAYDSGNLHWPLLLIAPLNLDVVAGEPFEVIGSPIPIGQIGAWPKSRLAPFEFSMIRQCLGKAGLKNGLAK